MSKDIIQPFDFKGHRVRTLTFETGQTWWVLKDVCDVLGVKNATDVAKRLDQDEVTRFNLGGLSGESNIVNESGLYKIILRSDKPQAHDFQRWVTHEVLPSIRMHGGYMLGQERMTPEQMALASMRWLQSKVREQEEQLGRQRPKVLFADAVTASHTDILVGDLAKILKGNGVDTGATRLFAWMREHGYLMKSGSAKNMPTQKSMELGLFRVKETTVVHSDGHTTINKTPKVTGKGQAYFISRFLDQKDMGVAA
ncbi:phage antirepressor KilAC domain-containing protein [Bifidobacterium sp. B4081]|uniref:phage antirepressor KilAC domain-containing protein n=1 Tax=unclassified Bifidobacterium TaxID=2608897 RepID=UPI002269E003|nr:MULTISPECIES: phage antirepressor KilAC domain-containing protein [unclassified Bifidobacterium]MCX8643206.1 phage antirepressor KilAC domain-containing protein [Bifidobacterium sp. B4077]MCX8645388.1 phage antirepressor KilAC domain-containing protein [Bifidobacterium sp. B4081]MCX8668902.1 phage antirepressor KilAC domain-containing protein [Bifidobacterium sp. B3998]